MTGGQSQYQCGNPQQLLEPRLPAGYIKERYYANRQPNINIPQPSIEQFTEEFHTSDTWCIEPCVNLLA